jgi:polyhydroxybutyrate depolymerase
VASSYAVMEGELLRIGVAAIGAAIVLGCSAAEGDGGGTDTDADATDADPASSSAAASEADSPSSTSGGGPTDDGDPDPSSESGEAGSSTGSGAPPLQCEVTPLFEAGMTTGITIDVDGVERSYDLFVPTIYDPNTAAPLVLNFHGLLGSPSQQVDFSQFNDAAEAHGMLVAYPAGIGASFNAGSCCGEASSSGVDDVGFARALVQDVALKMCVDPRRVYATGMSNGGHMAHRLACEAADLFAATASVTGALRLGECAPSRPISMVQYHGTSDTIVGYAEIPGMMEAWAARNGCSDTPSTTFEQGDMHCQTWPDCDAGVEVTLCTIDGGGHCWPGNGSCIFGHSSTELHASEAIATMFEVQPLP